MPTGCFGAGFGPLVWMKADLLHLRSGTMVRRKHAFANRNTFVNSYAQFTSADAVFGHQTGFKGQLRAVKGWPDLGENHIRM